jgi:dihydropteroate synthase
MHMQGEPRMMQDNPLYEDVGAEVRRFLLERAAACEQAGITQGYVVLDPGFGFGKTFTHNLELFSELPKLVAEGYPVLVGVSRKAMIGQITGRDAADRVAGSVAAALQAAEAGAAIIRVHDVAETVDALKVAAALAPD